MKKFIFNLSAISLALFSNHIWAEQPIPTQLQQVEQAVQSQNEEIVDSVTGVSYEVDENGQFARIRSTGEADLEFGDQKEIRVATQKAQMRAKANIAKFLSERVTSSEVLDYAEKMATNNQGKNKNSTRETVENYMENIKNSADALLKGVIATKTDINKDEKYVKVEMGLSKKTMAIADTVNNALRTDSTENNGDNLSTNGENHNGGGREVKKIKNYDNF